MADKLPNMMRLIDKIEAYGNACMVTEIYRSNDKVGESLRSRKRATNLLVEIIDILGEIPGANWEDDE